MEERRTLCTLILIVTFVGGHCYPGRADEHESQEGLGPREGPGHENPDGPDYGGRQRSMQPKELDTMNRQCEGEVCDHMDDLSAWLQIIYHKMTFVSSFQYFGNILTFGKHTFPILKMKDRDVTILAAAQLGKGRVIGAAHAKYAEMFGDTSEKISRNTRDTSGASCRDSVEGENYQGTVSQTVGGLTCQDWNSQTPHSHSYSDISKFPDSSHATLKNNCRNPDGEHKPWCYTTDPNKRWDYCDTPLCPGVKQDCRDTEKGAEYMGTISTTVSGRTCQAWAVKSPHSHSFDVHSGFPDSFADVHNYCRNPDNEPSPWCYTTDPNKRWELCSTPACTDGKLGQRYQLNKNLRNWLSTGKYVDESNICKLTDASSMACLSDSNVQIVYWDGSGLWATEQHEADLLAWVQAGGGLMWGLESWKWQDKTQPGKDGELYSSIPFYNTIEEAGMAFTYDWYNTDDEIPIPSSPEDIQDLLDLNFQVTASKISSMSDVNTNAAALDRWINVVDDDITRQIYPSMMSRMCDVMVPMANRMQPVMPWPAGSVQDPSSFVTVTADHQRMYKVYYNLGSQGKWTDIAPNVDKFPGTATEPQQTHSHTMEISTRKRKAWSTGMYLLPGQEMTIEVLSAGNVQYKQFQILIGCSTDTLYYKTELYRFPDIKRRLRIREATMKVAHMHGGLVFVESETKDQDHYIKVKISGVVEAPYFDLADADSVADWKNRRNAPGLWADINGLHQRYTVPASSVRDLEDPTEVMTIWDQVVEMDYILKGLPSDQWLHQWANTDIQISVGWMHAGYPVGTHLDKGDPKKDVFVLRTDHFEEQWGMYHEIGHNMQENAWTFADTGEVTTNIFSLFQLWRLFGDDPLNDQMLSTVNWDKYDAYLANMTYAAGWDNPWIPLLPYAQQATHFGWDCYVKVFSSYYAANAVLPQNDQQERDQWVQRWSEAVEYNLCPLWEFYSLPLSPDMCNSLQQYKPFLPDDIATQKPNAATLVSRMETKYPGLVRQMDNQPDCPARITQNLISQKKQQGRDVKQDREVQQLLEELLEQLM